MESRRLGRSGLKISAIGLGAWLTHGQTVPRAAATRIVRSALDAGVTFLDTADVYGQGAAESAWGEALAGVPRESYVLASKCFFPMSDHPLDRGLSRKHMRASIDASLKRLRTDHLDLYQCHRFDPDTPIDEVVRTMDDLVAAGKIHYWGVSCWTAPQIEDACRIAGDARREAPVSSQPPYNLLDREIEREVLPACGRLGVSQVVFSPLAQGVLTGKYRGGKTPAGSRAADPNASGFMDRYFTQDQRGRVDRLAAVAERAGVALPTLALAWCLRDPGVASVIVGAKSEEQLRENLKADGCRLSADVLKAVESALVGDPRP